MTIPASPIQPVILLAASHTGGFVIKGNALMIVNPNSLAALQTKWQGVIQMRERMDQLVISTFAFDPISSPVFGNIFYNLPLLLAFDVFRQVLLQAKEDRQFMDSGQGLADLLERTRTSLPWLNWQRLQEGAERQSALVHEGRLFGDKQCLQDIMDIEAQLLAWGIITAAEPSEVH
jgi:hypothetical protein